MFNGLKLASFLLLLFFLTSTVYAIGVSPSRIIIEFEPNLKKTYTYTAINNENKQVDVEMYVKGDLKDYINLKATNATLAPGETKSFTFEINLPSNIETPGTHDNRVGVLESIPTAKTGGAQVAARVGVEMQVWVRVPYPGKYAEVRLEAADVKVGDTVNFRIPIQNLGTEDFTASDEVAIFSPDGTKVTTVYAGSTNVKSKESGELTAEWDTEGIQPGSYRAQANVKYNGKSVTAEKSFNVGGLVVRFLDVAVDTIQKDTIGKFVIKVESLWNDEIKNVFAELFIFDENSNQIAKVKTESVDIQPNGKADITAFWDTKGLLEGTYEVKIVLHYADKTEEKIINVKIGGSKPPQIPMWLIASGAVAIVAIGAVIYFAKTKSTSVGKTWKQKKQSQ